MRNISKLSPWAATSGIPYGDHFNIISLIYGTSLTLPFLFCNDFERRYPVNNVKYRLRIKQSFVSVSQSFQERFHCSILIGRSWELEKGQMLQTFSPLETHEVRKPSATTEPCDSNLGNLFSKAIKAVPIRGDTTHVDRPSNRSNTTKES